MDDLTGLQFSYWRVIARSDPGKPGHVRWLCRCECGTTRSLRGADLRSGHSTGEVFEGLFASGA